MFDSSGVPIDGATFTYRDIQTGLAIVSTFTEVSAGLYTAVATTGLYDIYQNGSKDMTFLRSFMSIQMQSEMSGERFLMAGEVMALMSSMGPRQRSPVFLQKTVEHTTHFYGTGIWQPDNQSVVSHFSRMGTVYLSTEH